MSLKKESLEFVNFFTTVMYDDESGIFIIIFSGSMDKNPILKLQEKIKNMIAKRTYNFIIDVSNVTYISSSGLGFLMYIMKYRKNFIFLSSPPEEILKAFKLLDMDDLFKFYYNAEELKTRTNISDEVIQAIKDETLAIKTIRYKKRWVKIFRENFPTQIEATREVEKMLPYILQAEQANSISFPSDEKYTCVLYKFIDKTITRVAKIDREEVDDALVELIAKELMTNAVKHGYDHKKTGVIEANFKLDNEKLQLSVIDYGKGFSPSASTHNALPSAGLELLKRIFDNISISEAPKKDVKGLVLGKGTMVTMTKHLIVKSE